MHESNSQYVFEIIVLREEPRPATLQQKMPLRYMDPLPTQLQLVMKLIFQIYANMH